LALLIGAGIFFIPRAQFFQARVKELFAHEQFDDDARFALWKPALQLWQENVWWGIGPNHFNYRFRQYRPEAVQLQPDRVHNDYLNVLTDWGLAGAALVTVGLVLLVAGVVKTWRVVCGSPGDLGNRRSNKFAFVLGASLGLLAILFHSAVDFNLHIPANAILAVALAALLSGCLRFATERYWFTARLSGRAVLTIVLLAGLGYLGWEGVRRATEYVWLERAQRAPQFSPAQIAALEKAFAVEPANFETTYAIGEAFRAQSWQGGDDYRDLARSAMDWFDRGMKINPFDGYNYLRHGMCLDWLEQTEQAGPDYDRAVELDPNGYFTAANVGWHYVQLKDYAAAKAWFERSHRLEWKDNTIADAYLPLVTQRMLEAAAGGGGQEVLKLAR